MMIIAFMQVAFILAIFVLLMQSFLPRKREKDSFKSTFLVLEALLTILLLICFVMHELSSFEDEVAFPAFAILTGISAFFYWYLKASPTLNLFWKGFILTFLGSFFWLSLLTTIKFIPYLPYSIFPLFGLLAISPLLFTILTLSEIRYQSMLDSRFKPLQIILFGILPLIILQLIIQNIYPEPISFINMFDPNNSKTF